MKKLLLLCSLLVGTSALISCSSDDDSSEDKIPVANPITLSVDVTSIDKGGSVTFTVMNDLEENVTTSSTYFIDGQEISQVFTPSEAGSYTIHATNDNLISNTVTVEVNAVQEENSIFFKEENYKLENSLLAYYGNVDAVDDGVEENTHGYWVVAAGNGDFNTTDSTDYIYSILLTDITSEGEAYLPSSADNTYYYALALLTLDGVNIVENGTTEEDITFAINADFSETADFTYSASIINGTPIAIDYTGTYLGYADLTTSDRPSGVTSLSDMNLKIDSSVLKGLLRK
ncbi:hypothetical protein [Formosa sp. S-31]|uniref:hypothetical protein n=1 Tax=Formosa sp. S-31 TaxID=2790949 RepID=UPI003EBA628D